MRVDIDTVRMGRRMVALGRHPADSTRAMMVEEKEEKLFFFGFKLARELV